MSKKAFMWVGACIIGVFLIGILLKSNQSMGVLSSNEGSQGLVSMEKDQRKNLNPPQKQTKISEKFSNLLTKMREIEDASGEASLDKIFIYFNSIGGNYLTATDLLTLADSLNFEDDAGKNTGGMLLNIIGHEFAKNATPTDIVEAFNLAYKASGVKKEDLASLPRDLDGRIEFEQVFRDLFQNIPFSEENHSVANNIAELLASVAGEESTTLLYSELDSDNALKQQAAEYAVQHMHEERIYPSIAKIIEDENSSDRQKYYAIQALGNIDAEASAINLGHLSRDLDPAVAQLAQSALAKLLSHNEALRPLAEKAKSGEL